MKGKGEKLNAVRKGGFFVKGDVFIFVVLLVVVALATAAAFAFRGEKGGVARIYVDGALVREMDLGINAQYTVQTERGYNVVTVENGSVRVSEADCSDFTCIRQGKASRTGEAIICLPHGVKIVVSKKGTGGSDV